MFTEHSSLKYLDNKPLLGGKICHWLLLFQNFDFEIIVKLGHLNVGPDHLSLIEIGEEPTNIEYGFPYAQIFRVDMVYYYYDQIIYFFTIGVASEYFSTSQKKQLVVKAMDF